MNTLVVYYSRTDRTRFIAEKIAAELGADLEEIVDLKERQGMIGFMKASLAAMMSRETKIASTSKLVSQYELIVVGTPVWYFRPKPAITTYLKQNDLSGKRVAFFCTDDATAGEKALRKLKELTPDSKLIEPLIVSKVSENREEAVAKAVEWCTKLKASYIH